MAAGEGLVAVVVCGDAGAAPAEARGRGGPRGVVGDSDGVDPGGGVRPAAGEGLPQAGVGGVHGGANVGVGDGAGWRVWLGRGGRRWSRDGEDRRLEGQGGGECGTHEVGFRS